VGWILEFNQGVRIVFSSHTLVLVYYYRQPVFIGDHAGNSTIYLYE